MNIKKGIGRKSIIPVNSMSDIAFLLLIFIMLISLINYKKQVKIDYPEAELTESVNVQSNLELWVKKDGAIFHNGREIDIQTAEVIIVDTITVNPKTRIHVKADKNTQYRNVNKVLETLQLLQHRVVSLVVKETDT